MKKTTIKEVAQKAGVSIGTVSRVINNANVKEKNRLKVKAAIEELHFRPNQYAQGLKSNTSKTLGIIVNNLSPFSIFGLNLLNAIEQRATKEGYFVVILGSNNDPELEKKYIEFLWEKRVDGIVVVSTGKNEEMLMEICNLGTPVVFVDRRPVAPQAESVRVDKCKSAYLATEHFIKRGHKKIALANGPKDIGTCMDRFDGFVRALYDYDIPIENDYIHFGEFSAKSGCEFLNWFTNLNLDKRPTAVLCGGTSIGYGCLCEIVRLGISVPEDLSLICLGKPAYGELFQPKITYVDQLDDQVSDAAADLIYQKIKDTSTKNRQIVYMPKLVIGDSVKEIAVLDLHKG